MLLFSYFGQPMGAAQRTCLQALSLHGSDLNARLENADMFAEDLWSARSLGEKLRC